MAQPERQRSDNSELRLDEIVIATIALLDAEGLDGFTMRSLASRLGRSTMATYRHVESRESLLRLAAEEAQPEPPDLDDGAWHERLEIVIRDGWTRTWTPHPWIAELVNSGVVGPGSHRSHDLVRSIYVEAGFEGGDLARVLVAHWSFMIGTMGVVRRIEEMSGAPNESDDYFEFNLTTYILGVRAKAPS